MIQQIKERMKAWKRFYAGKTDSVDENSSWVDILLKLNLSFEESINLGKQAISECNPFSWEESLYLRQLPLYRETEELIACMPNKDFGNYCHSALPTCDNIYFVRYPKLSELQKGDNLRQVPIIMATIVYHKPVDFDEEIYTWCNLSSVPGLKSKHLIVRYVDVKDEENLCLIKDSL